MLTKKTRKYAILFATFLTCSIIALTIGTNFYAENETFGSKNDFDTTSLKTSDLYVDIEINALAHTHTTTSGNWTWAETQEWCTGSGTIGNPYVIANHIFEYSTGLGDCLRILNSRVHFIIRDCTFRNSDTGDSGLYIYNTTNGEVKDCFVHNNDDYGIHLLGGSQYNTISKNTVIYNGDEGIRIDSSNNNDIIQNKLNHNGGEGIYLSYCDDSIIYDNSAYNNTGYGIRFSGGNNNTCTHNTAYENQLSGIRLYETDESAIENNNAHHNGENGILLITNCRSNIVKSNTLQYNNISGIHIDDGSDSNLIMNNKASSNEEHGIFLDSSDNNALTGNTANKNEMNGIHLFFSDANSIMSNTANNNENGIFLVNSDNNIVVNNVFLGNDACYNETGSTGNIFENNRCTSPGGITIDPSVVLLIISIVEGVALAAIASTYFIRKRKIKR